MNKYVLASALTASILSLSAAHAGGKGGTEIGLASYNDIGVVISSGLPLDIEFLRSSGFRTYGEVELGAGFGDGVAIGGELSGGLLFAIDDGLSIYASLGPALGFKDDLEFGLGAEIGVNIDINDTHVFIEGGSHPASNYIAVGLSF